MLQSTYLCVLNHYYSNRLPAIAGVLRRRSTSTRCMESRNCSNLSASAHMVICGKMNKKSIMRHFNSNIPKHRMTTDGAVRCHYHQSCQVISRSSNNTNNTIRHEPLFTSAAAATFPEYSCPSVIITQPSERPKFSSTHMIQTTIHNNAHHHTATTTAAAFAATDGMVHLPESLTSSLLKQQQQQQSQTINSANKTTSAAATATATVDALSSHSNDTIQISDLRALFIASSIPMIGFGFMDQFVLIQAGGYIDATFGISFGLATLSAAAAGQVVSDVSGVVFGGALERFLTTNTSWLRTPNITQLQRHLPICRNVSMLGAIVGVIIGCALGATSLLFVDLEARNRMERAQRLREIVQDMITAAIPTTTTTTTTSGNTPSEFTNQNSSSDPVFSCDSCTVYVVSTKDLTLPADHNSADWKVNLKDISSSLTTSTKSTDINSSNYTEKNDEDEMQSVQRCITSRSIVLSDDRRIMYAPLLQRGASKDGQHVQNDIMAVVAFRYGTDLNGNSSSNATGILEETSNSTSGGYSDDDIITARVMARHIAIFMDR